MELTHYEILDVPRNASQEAIKAAYHALAKKYHPDYNASFDADTAELMKKINVAHDVLSHPDKRAEYDAAIDLQKAQSTQEFRAETREPESEERARYEYPPPTGTADREEYRPPRMQGIFWRLKRISGELGRILSVAALAALLSSLFDIIRCDAWRETFAHDGFFALAGQKCATSNFSMQEMANDIKGQ